MSDPRSSSRRGLVASLGAMLILTLLVNSGNAQFFPDEEPTNEQIRFGCDPGPVEAFIHSDPPIPPLPEFGNNAPAQELGLTVTTDGPVRVVQGAGFNLEHTLWSCRPFRRLMENWILEPFEPEIARVDTGQLPLAPESLDAASLGWSVYQDVMDAPKYRPSWEMLRRLNQQQVKIMLGVWGAPGAFTDDGTRRGRLLPEYFDHYVEYYEAIVDYLIHRQGITVWSATVMNEPDGGDGTSIDPDDFVELASRLGPRLAEYGVALYGPDTASAANAIPYVDRLLDDPSTLTYFNVIATHEYFAEHAVPDLIRTLRDNGSSLPVYVTEYTSFQFGAMDRGEEAWDEVGQMLDSLSTYASLMTSGADAALYWDAVDYYQAGHAAITRWGLLEGPQAGFAPRKRYYGFQQILPYVKEGARVLPVLLRGQHPANALAVMNRNESIDDMMVALVNRGGPISLTLSFQGPAPSVLDMYVTDRERDFERLGRVTVRDGRALLFVPAQSVMTLTTSPAPLDE